jgi:DNA primase
MEGAKDPDEYIIKYGNARFQALMDKAISLIEYKVKILKKDLNLENTSDKIKFLNEISKLISSVENNMEREVYIENIAKTYNISKEAIYAQVNKLKYSNVNNEKVLEKTRVVTKIKKEVSNVSEKIKKREDTILSLLLDENYNVFEIIKQNVKAEDFKYEIDKKIAIKLYEEFEKGNSNINSIIDKLSEEEQNHVTAILAEDYGIENTEKAIDDVLKNYEKEKLNERKQEIIKLRGENLSKEEQESLLKELNEIIYKLAKIK